MADCEKTVQPYYHAFLRKKGNMDGIMLDYQVNSVFRKICKCCDPFGRYERIKEIGAGCVAVKNESCILKSYLFIALSIFLESLERFIQQRICKAREIMIGVLQ